MPYINRGARGYGTPSEDTSPLDGDAARWAAEESVRALLLPPLGDAQRAEHVAAADEGRRVDEHLRADGAAKLGGEPVSQPLSRRQFLRLLCTFRFGLGAILVFHVILFFVLKDLYLMT